MIDHSNFLNFTATMRGIFVSMTRRYVNISRLHHRFSYALFISCQTILNVVSKIQGFFMMLTDYVRNQSQIVLRPNV